MVDHLTEAGFWKRQAEKAKDKKKAKDFMEEHNRSVRMHLASMQGI